jgi:hypothetical protein
MIFPCDYAFKKVKSVLKMKIFFKNKKVPNATWHGGRGLPPWRSVAGSWRRGVWQHMYISRNFWFVHLFFENQRKI